MEARVGEALPPVGESGPEVEAMTVGDPRGDIGHLFVTDIVLPNQLVLCGGNCEVELRSTGNVTIHDKSTFRSWPGSEWR